MKIKPMVLTELAGETMAVPVEDTTDVFCGVIRLNKTAVHIWHGIEDGKTAEELAADLVETYEGVDLPQAEQCVADVIRQLRDAGVLVD